MEGEHLNPSKLEVELADALEKLSDQLEPLITGQKLKQVEKFTQLDNPQLHLTLENEAGKVSEVVIRIIQRAHSETGDV
jgi:hypothetical protein